MTQLHSSQWCTSGYPGHSRTATQAYQSKQSRPRLYAPSQPILGSAVDTECTVTTQVGTKVYTSDLPNRTPATKRRKIITSTCEERGGGERMSRNTNDLKKKKSAKIHHLGTIWAWNLVDHGRSTRSSLIHIQQPTVT